jgi:hypothetical protein
MKKRNLLSALLNAFACLAWMASLILTPKDAGFPYLSVLVTAVFAACATFFWMAYMRERKSSALTSLELKEGEL